jgi:uncharacterized membrane protein YdjX (TVP38/TMEM64 family)
LLSLLKQAGGFAQKERGAMQKKRWIIFAIFILVIALVYFSGIGKYVTLENLKANRAHLESMVHEHYFFSVCLFIVVSAILTLTYLPVALLLALISGFLFKVIPGVFYVDLGVVIGATGMFFISRYFLGRFVQDRYNKRLRTFNSAVEKHGANFLLMIHFLSVVPLSILGTLAGLTNLSWFSFTWTAAVGFLPSATIFSYAGQQLSRVSSLQGIISVKMVIILILFALLAIAPIILKRFQYSDV